MQSCRLHFFSFNILNIKKLRLHDFCTKLYFLYFFSSKWHLYTIGIFCTTFCTFLYRCKLLIINYIYILKSLFVQLYKKKADF